MSEAEKFYDEEIAPALTAIAEKCMERDMPFVAVVEYAPGERGETRVMTPDAGLPMVMLAHCAKVGSNIDGFFIGLARYCRENNIDTSGSIVMKKLESGHD